MDRTQYQNLNAMRGVAALAVVIFHGQGLFGSQFAPSGYLAVDLFFVLSGFVIAYAYDRRLAAGMSWRDFALARLIRFYPLVIVAILLGALRAAAATASNSPTAFSFEQIFVASITNLFFIPAPLDANGNLFILNVPLWTLCFEILVNLIYAASFRYLRTPILVVVGAIGLAVFAVGAITHGNGDVGATLGTAVAGLGRAVFGFSLGCLLFRRGITIKFDSPVVTPLLLVLLAGFLVWQVPQNLRVAFDLGFAMLIAPLFVYFGAANEPRDKWLWMAKLLGAISFAIYAIHRPLLYLFETIADRLGVISPIAGILTVALLAVLALALDRYYDEPLRERLRLMSGRKLAKS